MDGNPRPRNYQNGAGNMGRPSNEGRRPPGAPGGPPSSTGSSSKSVMSRADRFEDERKRITSSCFSKLEADNSLHESYITHIRIQEDGAYPQSPPPPTASASTKKARVIVIAVKHTTQVQLHKARENANGTFSIGKTWHMADLSQIENYVHMTPSSEEEALHKQWAGDRGFVVSINKPYYWEASTAKEKEFFIGSMVKIYNKYTDKHKIKQGKFPLLTGFSPAEIMGLTDGKPYAATKEGRAAHDAWMDKYPKVKPPPEDSDPYSELRRAWERSRGSRGGPRTPQPPGLPSPGDPRRMQTPEGRSLPPPRGPGRPPTADGPQREGTPRRPGPPSMPNMREAGRAGPPGRPDDGRFPSSPRSVPPGQGTPPPGSRDSPRSRPSMEQNLRSRPSQENMALRSRPSRERMQPMPGMVPPIPTPPTGRLSPQSSRSDLRPKTPDAATTSFLPASLSVGRPPVPEDARSQHSQRSQEGSSFDGAGTGRASTEERRPNGAPLSSRREPSPRGLRPGTSQSNASSFVSRNEELPPEDIPRAALPERRRPQMESRPSQQSQRSMESLGSGVQTEFYTPTQSPAPPMAPPPRRRPQEIPERSAPPATSEPSRRQPVGTMKSPSEPQPPPTSPLPQLPKATEPTLPESKEPPAVTKTQAGKEAEAVSSAKPTSPTEDNEDESAHRPGLGPMIKKKIGQKDAANAFRKAAAAAGAFKPRAGGAAAKLFAKETKTSEEADGISGVFVPQRPTPKEEPEKKVEEQPKPQPDRMSKEPPKIDTEVVPEVKVSSPLSPTPVVAPVNLEEKLPSRPVSPEKPAGKAKPEPEVEARRKKRRSNQQIMNISKLGIDPSTLDERGLEFEILLAEFGWGSSELSAKNIESLESDIKREIARVEAGSWLNHLEQKDDRVEAVEKMLDRAIAECDELEGLLTLYNVELSSLNDDIAFIEAQSQGLQVQTANQRLLQNELKQLVDTISITSDQLEPLRRAPIGKINGLKAIEASLVLLYKALITIDPNFIEGARPNTSEDLQKIPSSGGFGNSELASMQALQEKKDRYLNEGAMFLDRLKKHMEITFGAAFLQTKDALANIDKTAMPSTKANIEAHDAGRNMLWMVSPLILFAKEIDRASWDALIRMYQVQAGQIYQDEVRDHILSWKRFARRPTGEEQELLFTAQEKEVESITGAARKLTVKRSQTLARGLRNASGDKEKANRAQDGKLFAFDVFSRILEGIGPVLLTEQNFVTEFFHATSTESVDFPETVNAAPPEARQGPNLWARKQFEADRAMAKRVAEVMEDIFSFWPTEVQNLVEWAVKADPLQGVGILCAVDRKLVEIEDSNQDFLTRNLQKVHERLTSLFIRFVDEQIRAIEDTKVKIKKRKGVIAFMKTFPHFAIAIENMLPASDETDQLEIRRMVDDAYQKINKAMFESLKVIAKESPAVMATQGQGDPEDKEALNYHILLIENMNHYMEEVDARPDSVLLDWKIKAQDEMKEHMDLYVDAVIRRPLGKLLEFIESTETLLAHRGASAQSIAQRSSHSRSVFKKLVHSYDAKEIRKGIEALKKRVDKHFGDADDPTISRDLVFKVLKECEKKYSDVYDRSIRINQDVYSGEVEMDWGPNEVSAAFRR
ncbi:hypothetical protein K458DRAFT_381054 [Lentithecium fluviatile CBS 122367]|uniref:Exocyst complex component Sec3 PIP2-binding N-terminal domain-containing protein n=1 Tax=Lentithecium fluviatile CBS 122367 TaxID=1168545 RepID=A0A6G1IBX2_9PLEO|nr:hypothetical protein K458DRAFT_381054 [Lentithecium fluviatile CBS 122367]